MDTKNEHWLKEILLDFQSEDDSLRAKARNRLSVMAEGNLPDVLLLGEAIAFIFLNHCFTKEKEEFLNVLNELLSLSKKNRLSLESMETLVLIVGRIGKTEDLIEGLAHVLSSVWRNAKEREVLARTLLSQLDELGESQKIYLAIRHLLKYKWIPRMYAIDTCIVLLRANPGKWLSTYSIMIPQITRYKNKLLREDGESGEKTWCVMEAYFKEELHTLGLQ